MKIGELFLFKLEENGRLKSNGVYSYLDINEIENGENGEMLIIILKFELDWMKDERDLFEE